DRRYHPAAAKRMSGTVLGDGRTFGDIRLSRLTWSDIEALYGAMRGQGHGSAWVRTRTSPSGGRRGANPLLRPLRMCVMFSSTLRGSIRSVGGSDRSCWHRITKGRTARDSLDKH